jgi:hypothetical protein
VPSKSKLAGSGVTTLFGVREILSRNWSGVSLPFIKTLLISVSKVCEPAVKFIVSSKLPLRIWPTEIWPRLSVATVVPSMMIENVPASKLKEFPTSVDAKSSVRYRNRSRAQ